MKQIVNHFEASSRCVTAAFILHGKVKVWNWAALYRLIVGVRLPQQEETSLAWWLNVLLMTPVTFWLRGLQW